MSPLVTALFAASWLVLASLYLLQRRQWQVALVRNRSGTRATLGRLIDVCIDDERMLEHESRSVRGHRRAVLGRLAVERSGFVDRLRGLGNVDERSRHGSWSELGRELGRRLRARLGGSNNGDSVAACRRSCERAEARFDAALDLSWPDTMRAELVEQRARLDVARDALIAIEY